MRDLCVVYSLHLMNRLVRKGFDCRQVEDDSNNPIYKVFLFDNTPEINSEIEKYKEEQREKERGKRDDNRQRQKIFNGANQL